MATESFNCPNCGAPLDYDGSGAPTIRCPYCQTSVVVPETLRPEPDETPEVVINLSPGELTQQRRSGSGLVIGFIIFIVLIVGVTTIVPIVLSMQAQKVANQVMSEQFSQVKGVLTEIPGKLTPSAIPSHTPKPSPTPAYMNPKLTFGQKGTGPGMFNDARYIAIDHQGMVYVADYQGGRVQVFDSTGKYLRQWKVGSAKTIIYGLAADREGRVYIAFNGDIVRYNGSTGEQQAKLTNPNGGEYGDITIGPDGSLYAMWYEGRWGIITSLEGHREDLVIYSPTGKLVKTIQGVISGQTEELALDVFLAVDGEDNIFALNEGSVFQFTPQGKYVNRWSAEGGPDSIAVDGQGQVYTASSNGIFIYNADGKVLNSFPTRPSAGMMVIDDDGAVWTISREQVIKYVK